MSPDKLQGSTIVVTGVTGQVARPLATALARDNRVIGAARFSDAAARTELEAAGVECVPIDLVSGDMGKLPEDAEYVLNFAVAKTNDWEKDLAANSGGLAYLMEHHRRARAFLHCSSTAVYKPEGHRVFDEEGPLGDNHGVWPFLRTYSICKIAAEGTARWGGRALRAPDHHCPTVRAVRRQRRVAGHPPAHDAERVGHPRPRGRAQRLSPAARRRHPAMVPRLLAAASVPAVTVNWGGSEPVSIEEWCTYLAGLAGTEARFEPTAQTIDSVAIDTTRMHELAGQTTRPVARGHARVWPRRCIPTWCSERRTRAGLAGELRFVLCDPEEPPASELLAAMRTELDRRLRQRQPSRQPAAPPGRAARARRRLLRRVRRSRRPWRAGDCGVSATAWRKSSGCTCARRRGRAAWRRRCCARSRRRPGRWATRARASTPVPSR